MTSLAKATADYQLLASRILLELQEPKPLTKLAQTTNISGSALFDCLERLIDEGLVTVDHAYSRCAFFRTTSKGNQQIRSRKSQPHERDEKASPATLASPAIEKALHPPRFVRAYRGRILVPREHQDGSGWICHINIQAGRTRETLDFTHGNTRQEAIQRAMSQVDTQLNQVGEPIFA